MERMASLSYIGKAGGINLANVVLQHTYLRQGIQDKKDNLR
jgi:hypothetical protein